MLLLATWGKLSYYMLSGNKDLGHVILVEDTSGKRGTFKLETAKQISSNLNPEDNVTARRMINDMKTEFLEYWGDYKHKSAIS